MGDREVQRQRKVRQRMTLPYETVLEQARNAQGSVAQSLPVETAVFCTAVLECVCCALLRASTESAQDDEFWNRKGKTVSQRYVRGVLFFYCCTCSTVSNLSPLPATAAA